MASERKAEILAAHEANAALNSPLPAPVLRDGRDFSADEQPSPLDERIIAGAAAALEAGQTHYVDVPGIPPLRAAMADFLNDNYGSAYAAENIIITAGVQEARFLTIQKIGELYDSIALPAVAHPGARKALGVRPRSIITLPVDSARGYLPSVDSIAEAVAAGCRWLYLESPSRLSGAAYSAAEVAAIRQISQENEVAVVWDQGLASLQAGAYSSLAAAAGAPAHIATLGDAWPGMGLSSWFIGYIAAPTDWIPSMQSQKQIMAICTSTAAQYAALEASRIYAEERPSRLAQLRRLRQGLLDSAKAQNLAVVQGDTVNLLALQVEGGAAAACAKLRAAGLTAADGGHFGAPDFIRLTVSPTTAAALDILGA